MENIVFLDAETIGPGIVIRKPAFAHNWTEYDRTDPEDTASRIADATIVITNKVRLPKDVLAQAPNLKFIAVAATGFDVIDIAGCKDLGITVANIRGYAINTVPEHTFGLITALRRNLVEYRAQVLDGDWQRAKQFCFFNRPIWDLNGARIGIVGAGAIGQAVGRTAQGFGMDVAFHSPRAKTAPEGTSLLSLEELRDTSDVITLHCPLTDETALMINETFLSGMKETAILINTARGGLVDEPALLNALQTGQIAGAGLDVVTQEPPELDSVSMQIAAEPTAIVTPHVGWASQGAMQTLVDQLIDNIEAFQNGTPQHVVV